MKKSTLKKFAEQSKKQRESIHNIRMELKRLYAENPMTLAAWSVYTRYFIIEEIIPDIAMKELKDLLVTLHAATSAATGELAKRDGLET